MYAIIAMGSDLADPSGYTGRREGTMEDFEIRVCGLDRKTYEMKTIKVFQFQNQKDLMSFVKHGLKGYVKRWWLLRSGRDLSVSGGITINGTYMGSISYNDYTVYYSWWDSNTTNRYYHYYCDEKER